MKTPPTRRRRALRWSVYGCTTLAVILIVVSIWVEPYYYSKSPTNASGISRGYSLVLSDAVLTQSHWQELPVPPIASAITMSGTGKHGALLPQWYSMPNFPRGSVDLPLAYPTALLLIASAWLFWSSRSIHRPGHCFHCNYNLAGLESKTCPECGEDTTP